MIKIIAAIGTNNELGKNNSLPLWKLAADFKRFKELTEGYTVVMGRKTFESLPEKFRPLPNRKNIVLTRDKTWRADKVEIFENLDEFLNSNQNNEVWVIGGSEIYNQALHKVDELHITHVDGHFDADVYFPQINKDEWKILKEEAFPADDKNSHPTKYTIYQRVLP